MSRVFYLFLLSFTLIFADNNNTGNEEIFPSFDEESSYSLTEDTIYPRDNDFQENKNVVDKNKASTEKGLKFFNEDEIYTQAEKFFEENFDDFNIKAGRNNSKKVEEQLNVTKSDFSVNTSVTVYDSVPTSLSKTLNFFNTELLANNWKYIQNNLSKSCQQHVDKYIGALRSQENWALKSKFNFISYKSLSSIMHNMVRYNLNLTYFTST